MDAQLDSGWAMAALDRSIAETFVRQRARLRGFIRKRVPDPADAEDILQEVFYELVEAARLVRPVEQVSAWIFTVARNRITDLFRKKKSERFGALNAAGTPRSAHDAADTDETSFEDARRLLLDELDAALDELPEEQRSVFVAHELEGRSFKELAAQSGVTVNTLLSRKRYAVLYLRRRLQAIYDEFIDT